MSLLSCSQDIYIQENDTMVVVSIDDVRRANQIFLERDLYIHMYERCDCAYDEAQEIISTYQDAYDTTRLRLERQTMKRIDAERKIEDEKSKKGFWKGWAIGSSGVAVVLLILLI